MNFAGELKMNIEIIECFPSEKRGDILTGTLRIRIVDLKIHLLGVYFCRRKDSWYFSLPGRTTTNSSTNEPVRFPYITFEDRELQKVLMTEIRQKGRDFIESRLADASNPLIFPEKKEKELNEAKPFKPVNVAPETKETATVKSSVKASSVSKTWITPPPRKFSRN
jgi:hypothetical protein